ncbi:MAG: DUF58 domain-containing protein [Planctomycetota bacterium]|jgi:uncharacterized protein (DUF58 family)
MLPPELLKSIRRIEIKTSHLVNEALAGQYHSAFKGHGMEFEEVRLYLPGDDVRQIDWNVSARTGHPHVKVFREERELTVMLLVDVSGSQSFGSTTQLKRELVAEIGAILAFSATFNNDKVGLLCFSDRIERHVPPRKGRRHVLRVIRDLLAIEPEGRGTDIEMAVEHLNKAMRRKAVVFVISDFQDAGYERALQIARRRHDVILIDVGDLRERELPKVGLIELEDQETGEHIVVDTGSRRFRERFAAIVDAKIEQRTTALRRCGLERIAVNTGEGAAQPLMAFFRAREARR